MGLFQKKIEPRCTYCARGRALSEDQVICDRKGVMSAGSSCRSFKYDPLKRVPPRPAKADFSRLKEGDYVQLGCGSNLISGFLEEATDYDLILDKNFSQISEVYLGDIEDFARKEKNGRWAVDKSAISVARTNNARGEEIIWLSAI